MPNIKKDEKQSNQPQPKKGVSMSQQNASLFEPAHLYLIKRFIRLAQDQSQINVLFDDIKGGVCPPLSPSLVVYDLFEMLAQSWEEDLCANLTCRRIDDVVKRVSSRFGIQLTIQGLRNIEPIFNDWCEYTDDASPDLKCLNNRLYNWLELCIERASVYGKTFGIEEGL